MNPSSPEFLNHRSCNAIPATNLVSAIRSSAERLILDSLPPRRTLVGMGSNSEKWNRIYRSRDGSPPTPAQVLADYTHLLPRTGNALDLACGTGGNALLLAAHGLDTSAWDCSAEALQSLRKFAASRQLSVTTQERDVIARPPRPHSFDVIVVSRFLDRGLVPGLIQALRPAGLIFYQTFISDSISDAGPRNPEYRLAPNEFLKMFQQLQIIVHREEGSIGDTERGFRNEAMLIARKPES